MHALNSTYPNSWPGAGLLLIRLAVGTTSVTTAAPLLLAGVVLLGEVGLVLQIASATLLILGLWTPIVGIILALVEVYRATTGADHVDLLGVLRAAIAMSLVMTGPGAWSIDARVFGRRRIDVIAPGD
jgi:putative oxidoreductase